MAGAIVLARPLKHRSCCQRHGLLFVEGYRPPALQHSYFQQYADELRAATSRYVSPPEIAATAPAGQSPSRSCPPTDRKLDTGPAHVLYGPRDLDAFP